MRLIFDLQMDSQKYRCCTEQDLLANERKILILHIYGELKFL